MTTAKSTGDDREARRQEADLNRRYGRIAISAVVAALPYGGESKRKTAVSPDPHKDRAA
jgi:hypothetical protein